MEGGTLFKEPSLDELCYIFGFPKSIQSDNGATFAVKSTQQWAAPWDIRWTFHALDHPQAAGATERWNGFLKEKHNRTTKAQIPVEPPLKKSSLDY